MPIKLESGLRECVHKNRIMFRGMCHKTESGLGECAFKTSVKGSGICLSKDSHGKWNVLIKTRVKVLGISIQNEGQG